MSYTKIQQTAGFVQCSIWVLSLHCGEKEKWYNAPCSRKVVWLDQLVDVVDEGVVVDHELRVRNNQRRTYQSSLECYNTLGESCSPRHEHCLS